MLPSMSACAPLPSRFLNPVALGAFTVAALRTIACAREWSDPASTAADDESNWSSEAPAAVTRSTTSGWPIVGVPVLSKMTTFSLVVYAAEQ